MSDSNPGNQYSIRAIYKQKMPHTMEHFLKKVIKLISLQELQELQAL